VVNKQQNIGPEYAYSHTLTADSIKVKMRRPLLCDGTGITRKFTYFYIATPTLTSNSMIISKL